MKRTVTLALLLTAAICWAQVAVNYIPDENAVRTFGGAAAPPETVTVVLAPKWLASSSSPDYPAESELDLLVQDTDGSLFKYLEVQLDDTLDLDYSSTAVRGRGTWQEPLPNPTTPGAGMRFGGIHFPLDTIPAGAAILDAKLCMYSINPASDVVMDWDDEFVAVLDTFDLDWSRFIAGAAQTGDNNPSAHSPNFAFANYPGGIRWKGGSLTSRTAFTDFGIRQTLVAQRDTLFGGWNSFDVTPLVQAHRTIEGEDKSLIWFDRRGNSGASANFTAGVYGTAANQPFMVVKYVTGPAYEPFDMFVFSDNHSAQEWGTEICTAMGGDAFADLAISNGDQNYGNWPDSTLTAQWVSRDLNISRFLPLMGNHEYHSVTATLDDSLVWYCVGKMEEFYNGDLMGGPFHWRQHGHHYPDQYKPRTNGSFDVGRVHITMWNPMNKNDGNAAPSQADLDWLVQDIGGSGQAVNIVLTHKPWFQFDDMDYGFPASHTLADSLLNGGDVWDLAVAAGMDAVIVGHTHKASAENFDGAWHINTASTGTPYVGEKAGYAMLKIGADGYPTVEMWRENAGGTAFTLTKTIRLQ